MRNNYIHFKVNPVEFKQIKRFAKQRGISVSEVIRSSIMSEIKMCDYTIHQPTMTTGGLYGSTRFADQE